MDFNESITDMVKMAILRHKYDEATSTLIMLNRFLNSGNYMIRGSVELNRPLKLLEET